MRLNGNFLSRASSFDRDGTFQPGHLADPVQTPQERPERPQESESNRFVKVGPRSAEDFVTDFPHSVDSFEHNSNGLEVHSHYD